LWGGFAYANSNCCCVGNGNRYGNGNCHRDRNCDRNGNANAYRNSTTEGYAHATGASYSASSTVSLWACVQLSSGTREIPSRVPGRPLTCQPDGSGDRGVIV
jgi:hypothetical protein